jgi:hypothetical protein
LLLAVFDAIAEYVSLPEFRGCAVVNPDGSQGFDVVLTPLVTEDVGPEDLRCEQFCLKRVGSTLKPSLRLQVLTDLSKIR